MGDEWTLASNAFMQGLQLLVIALGGEVGDGPEDLAEEVHDCSNVVEHGPQRLLPHVDHSQPDPLRLLNRKPLVLATG